MGTLPVIYQKLVQTLCRDFSTRPRFRVASLMPGRQNLDSKCEEGQATETKPVTEK